MILIPCDIGDAVVVLLKAGAETDKKDMDGNLALDLTPDREVSPHESLQENKPGLTSYSSRCGSISRGWQRAKASRSNRGV
jgi:hypothetical protein